MRVLLIDDDDYLVDRLQQALVAQHYLVEVARDGQAGLALADSFEYDLILLDLMLPSLDGISFCQQLRAKDRASSLNSRTPILLMTAQDVSTSKIAGLDAGADDYLVKPFDIDELFARMRALLRRGGADHLPLLIWGQLQLDPRTCLVHYEEQPVHLSVKEYRLLELFLRHPQRIFSHGALIDHVWAMEAMPTENAIRAQIKGLRKRLKQVGVDDCIETVYGLGYRLKEPLERVQAQAQAQHAALPQHSAPEAPVSQIWERQRHHYRDRLRVIEQAIEALYQRSLTDTLWQQALREAHTLKGSLGLFGLVQASQLVGEIEQALKGATTLNQAQLAQLEQSVQTVRQIVEQPLGDIGASSVRTSRSAAEPPLQAPQEWDWSVLIVDDDQAATEALVKTAAAWNVQTQVVTNLKQARAAIAAALPRVVLLALRFTDSPEDGLALLAELSTQHPSLPVFAIAAPLPESAPDHQRDRLRVAQLGGKGFLQKPIAPTHVLAAIVTLLQASSPAHAKILIVDDDLALLNHLYGVLQPWGFQMTLLSDPQQFWSTLEATEPDLVILDIEMPDITGLALCQVVRNDLRWGDLPILFLSAHTDEATVQQVFLMGGDDYVEKPIRAAELVARVTRRLEHARVIKKLRGLGGA